MYYRILFLALVTLSIGASFTAGQDLSPAISPPRFANSESSEIEAFRSVLTAYLAEREVLLSEIMARHDTCDDPLERIEIQRGIQDFNLQTEIGWFELQLTRAEQRGDSRLAEQLRRTVGELRAVQSGAGRQDPVVDRPVVDGEVGP